MKSMLLRIVNILLIISVVLQAATIIAIKVFGIFNLPGEAHEWNGYAFGVLLIAHLVLNWPWIRMNILGRSNGK
ncbi:MAG: hypothetical protein HZC28_17770 [Spirochaetes bacterium]|nr:hypothetical protein [Spirochaetota bacterium]